MKNMPRILPLVGVAVAGVLAVNALSGARSLPDLMSGAKAFAEEAAKPLKGGKKAEADAAAAAAADETAPAAGDAAKDASALPPGGAVAAAPPVAACAPTAAELAKEAGLSPAELQMLQNLGARRGQLDQRENDLDTQLALMAAAEAKLDAKVQALTGLKSDIQGLMGQADSQKQAEVDRMVKVFEGMKPKDAAPRLVVLADSVRLPIAAKMKERALSAVLAQMSPNDAKTLTEALADRFAKAQGLATGATAKADAAAAATKTPPVAGKQAAAPAAAPGGKPKA
ncbi:MotE family protein [Phenylobacterium aquaticum]|uniref:MotE family protein n=2 Tax=Phenylobacterium aquaticum TaxID=1763816 RepID=UPI0026F19361|nr:MotE family protein [Phenylobacterium aquaticum]